MRRVLEVPSQASSVWVERDNYHRTQARYNQVNGDPATAPLLNEPVHLQRDYVSTRDSVQIFLKDVISLVDDRLKVELGAKSTSIDYEIAGYRNPGDYIAQRQPSIEDKWEDHFLPQVGAVYDLTNKLIAATPDLANKLAAAPPLLAQAINKNDSASAFLHLGEMQVEMYAVPVHKDDKVVGGLVIVHDASYIHDQNLKTWRESFLRILLQVLVISIVTLLIVRWSVAGPKASG